MSDLRIHAALSPRVAVLASPDVDRVIQLNAIPDLPTLLRPFEFSVQRLSVRTSQLETRICDRFPLRFDSYALFNGDAASAVGDVHEHAQPRPEAVAQSQEELLDRVNQLIASNIKTWDGQVPRPVSTADDGIVGKQQRHNDRQDDREDRTQLPLDESLERLRRGSLQELTPWFDAVQQLVFGQRTIAKHESFGHPVAVLLAVSSASPDPMNDFAKLYEATSHASPFPAHPYINPDTLKYYVLIHDVRTSGTDLASSKEILEQVKKTYGLHCCMLTINSASEDRVAVPAELAELWVKYLPSMPSSPVPTTAGAKSSEADSEVARLLDEEDVKRIKGFIRELTAQSIVPFMERCVQHMGDHLANSRKGLTNRLFGASRKLFGGVASGGDKSAAGAPAGGLTTSGGYDQHHDFYPYTSIEAQTRRLADFAFTIRDYKLAASMYDMGRKDFASDKASRHAAGATEMFGLSHLMIMYTSRSAPIDVDSYLAQACYEYDLRSSTRGSSASAAVEEDNLALRATLLYYEAYRMLGYLQPAPAGLLRMSQRADEVLAPLLLEQAALACLQLKPRPALRKFALYLVTAAHRYQACGQKILSLRCYAQAALVYRRKGWALIENHIEHELGMQAYNEGDSDTAVAHLVKLIRPSANSSAEHERFLQDVQTAYKYSGERGTALALPFDVFDTASAVLRFVPESSASATATVDEAVWARLEEQLVQHGLGERTLKSGEKRRRKRPTSRTSTQARQVPVGQTFWLEVEVRNPLGVEVAVDAIRPVLQQQLVDGTAAELGADDFECEDAGRCTLGPLQSRKTRVAMRVNKEAQSLRVSSIRFKLADTIDLVQQLDKKGPRLNTTKQHRTSTTYGPDLSLAISVHAPRPTLTARIVDAPPPQKPVFLGELVRLKVVLKNEGTTTIDDVRALCDQPEAAAFGSDEAVIEGDWTVPNHLGAAVPQSVFEAEGHAELAPGEEVEVDLTVRPVRTGDVSLAWLVPFSSEDGETYLSRLALLVHVVPAVQVSVQTRPLRSSSTACVHEVAVEVKSLVERDEVQLRALSVLSPRWVLAGEKKEAGAIVIAPKQVWRGRVQVEAVQGQQGKEEEEEYTATKLQDLLLSRDTRRPPPQDARVQLSTHTYASTTCTFAPPLHTEARKAWRRASLALDFPTISSRERAAAFTLWEARELDVLVHLSIEQREGQLAVHALQPGPLRSGIRAITHPPQLKDAGKGTGQVRSLYAETLREKASLLNNVVSSRLGSEQCPVVVHVETEAGERCKWTFVVRNFSDRYTARVTVQLTDSVWSGTEVAPGGGGGGWVGRKTLRCTLEPAGVAELAATRQGGEEEARFSVVTETFLRDGAEGLEEVVGQYVEHHQVSTE